MDIMMPVLDGISATEQIIEILKMEKDGGASG